VWDARNLADMCVGNAKWGCGKKNKYVPHVVEIPDMALDINIVKERWKD
jgi:hypothetical protein